MQDDELRRHIESAAPRGTSDIPSLAAHILGSCWPGGAEDRSERLALGWVRRWRPERVGLALPSCSCPSGRCAVCN